MNFWIFLDFSINILILQKIEGQKNYMMKTKGAFVKIVLLNEVVKHHLFKPNFDIRRFFDSFYIFQYLYYSISITFHDSHAIKVAPHK
jgi:hypothetical protein